MSDIMTIDQQIRAMNLLSRAEGSLEYFGEKGSKHSAELADEIGKFRSEVYPNGTTDRVSETT